MKNKFPLISILILMIMTPLFAKGQEDYTPEAISPFREIGPGIFQFTDSINTYVLKSGSKGLLIETGRGEVKEHLHKLGIDEVEWILHTHAHRDLVQGDNLFASEGTQIAVPEGTEDFFIRAEENWYNRRTYFPVEYGEGYFLPLRNIPVHKTLKGGDIFQWKDYSLKIKRTLGHSQTHLSFILEKDDAKYGFTGDIIHSAGKIWELESLQDKYEEFGQGMSPSTRISRLLKSLQILRMQKLDFILPAHGEPFGDTAQAIALLEKNIMNFLGILGDTDFFAESTENIELPWIKAYQTVATQYLIEDEGYAILYDAGFNDFTNPMTGEKKDFIAYLKNREADGSLKDIEIITTSHFHSDHNSLINGFAEHFDSEVYMHESMVDIHESPERFFLPCSYMYPIKVDRSFAEGESFQWRGITMTFYHFPGQTWWHQAMLAEKDGIKVLFVGDSLDDFHHLRTLDPWNYTPVSDTVGAMQCVEVLELTKPDYIATGHSGLKPWKEEYTIPMREFVHSRNSAMEALIGQDDANLGNDNYWVRMDPFRIITDPGTTVPVTVKVRNHLNKNTEAQVSLVLKEGWSVQPASASIPLAEGEDGSFTFSLTVPSGTAITRHMIGIDAVLDGRKYGELGMGLIDMEMDHELLLRNPGLVPGVSSTEYGRF